LLLCQSVHPRACGEHMARPAASMSGTGSSPRMRGTQLDVDRLHCYFRFIPAHAGNTDGTLFLNLGDSVHPRACGEHSTAPNNSAWINGSSPRMRGTPDAREDRRAEGRFIPAHAGNTLPRGFRRHEHPVHPRACGEHCWRRYLRPAGGRFIPAHAGNTVNFLR